MPTLKNFSLTGAAGNLEGIVHLPDAEPQGIAIVAHPLTTMGGTMENKVVTTLAKTFVELGLVALRFNFRGAGASEGAFDAGDGEVDDVLAVVDFAQQEFGALPLILAGFSFGGYVQARAAQQLHTQQLVLIAPAVGRFAPATTLRAEMPQVPRGTLLIHGDEDEVVALDEVLRWSHPQELPVMVLPGADHFFHGRLNQIRQIVLDDFNGEQP